MKLEDLIRLIVSRNKGEDQSQVDVKTSVRLDKFDGEPKEGDQPVETIIIDEEGNKTIIGGKEESLGSK